MSEQKRGNTIREFEEHKVVRPAVLIVEPNPYHGEILPGFAKYFQDLDYNVDILIRVETQKEKPFIRYTENLPTFFEGTAQQMKAALKSKKMQDYDFLFFSTNVLWEGSYFVGSYLSYLRFFPKTKFGIVFVEHNLDRLRDDDDDYLFQQGRFFTLTKESYNGKETMQLNPHYFGKIQVTGKNEDFTRFLVVGTIYQDSKNFDLLLSEVENLLDSGIYKFSVDIVGSGQLKLPAKLKEYIHILGRLDFDALYAKLETADFLLSLLDPAIDKHKRYLKGTTSGTVQLSLGFRKPMIINRKFAKRYGFDKRNSLIYSGSDLFESMALAIKMGQRTYKVLQSGIRNKAKLTQFHSIRNLSVVLDSMRRNSLTPACLLGEAELIRDDSAKNDSFDKKGNICSHDYKKHIIDKLKQFNPRLFLIKYGNKAISKFHTLWIGLNKSLFIRMNSNDQNLARVVDILNVNFFDWDGEIVYKGGAERYVYDLALLIEKIGYQPRIVQNANKYFEKKWNGIVVIGIPAKSGWDFVSLYKYYLDYFNGSDRVICSPLDIANARSGKRVIGINHGIHWDGVANRVFLNDKKKFQILFKALNNISSGVCVDTNFINWVRTFDRTHADKLDYIPNYYDGRQFQYTEKNFDDQDIVILYPRRLYAQRGLHLVIDIIDDIFEEYTNVRFRFVGQADGDDVELMKRYLNRYPGRIEWEELDMDKMGEVYQESQIVLIPTVASEGTSLSCIEAMATNNAVIATNIGGLPNLVLNNFNGILIQPTTFELKRAIVLLVNDRTMRRNIAKNAFASVQFLEKEHWEKRWREVLERDFDMK